MIEPIMPYTNVEIFREKEAKTFSKKVWEPLNFMKKIFDNINLNLNLNHKCLVLTWRKPTWFLSMAVPVDIRQVRQYLYKTDG
jgi:hypothetical protein